MYISDLDTLDILEILEIHCLPSKRAYVTAVSRNRYFFIRLLCAVSIHNSLLRFKYSTIETWWIHGLSLPDGLFKIFRFRPLRVTYFVMRVVYNQGTVGNSCLSGSLTHFPLSGFVSCRLILWLISNLSYLWTYTISFSHCIEVGDLDLVYCTWSMDSRHEGVIEACHWCDLPLYLNKQNLDDITLSTDSIVKTSPIVISYKNSSNSNAITFSNHNLTVINLASSIDAMIRIPRSRPPHPLPSTTSHCVYA